MLPRVCAYQSAARSCFPHLACFPRAYLLFFLTKFFPFPLTTLLPSLLSIAFQPASYLCFNSSLVRRFFWCRLHQHLIQARCIISNSLLWVLSAPYLKLLLQVSTFAYQCENFLISSPSYRERCTTSCSARIYQRNP